MDGVQVCKAVQALHRQQPPLAHRDIKPHNVLLQRAHSAAASQLRSNGSGGSLQDQDNSEAQEQLLQASNARLTLLDLFEDSTQWLIAFMKLLSSMLGQCSLQRAGRACHASIRSSVWRHVLLIAGSGDCKPVYAGVPWQTAASCTGCWSCVVQSHTVTVAKTSWSLHAICNKYLEDTCRAAIREHPAAIVPRMPQQQVCMLCSWTLEAQPQPGRPSTIAWKLSRHKKMQM